MPVVVTSGGDLDSAGPLLSDTAEGAGLPPPPPPPPTSEKYFPQENNEIRGARTWGSILGTQTFFWSLTPRVTSRRAAVSLPGPGQSPVPPSACCVGSLRSVGRCGRCSCWCRICVRGAQIVGVPGLCWMWQDVPFARQRRPVVGALGLCWLMWGLFDCLCCPDTSVLRLPPPRCYISATRSP